MGRRIRHKISYIKLVSNVVGGDRDWTREQASCVLLLCPSDHMMVLSPYPFLRGSKHYSCVSVTTTQVRTRMLHRQC